MDASKKAPDKTATKNANGALSLWNEGPTRDAIVNFVTRVTSKDSSDFVEPENRIAVFDNDGTLWCEKPMPIELGFILQRLAEMADREESLREKQPWKAACEQDYKWLGEVVTRHYQGDDSGAKVLMGGILKAFEGMKVEHYQAAAEQFLREAENPGLKRQYLDTAYAPMIELLDYLADHGFTNYIASGGDRDFMRTIAEEMYGVPNEQVIGSSSALRYQSNEKDSWVEYAAEPDVFDDGPTKPVRIWSRVGRRPILAVGNSNGDIPMLEFTANSQIPSLSALVDHDDDEREVAYAAGAEKLLDHARDRKWPVISVKNDWKSVFVE